MASSNNARLICSLLVILKTGQPPVAIGSSTNGVTDGGQKFPENYFRYGVSPVIDRCVNWRDTFLSFAGEYVSSSRTTCNGCAGARPRFNSFARWSSITGECKIVI